MLVPSKDSEMFKSGCSVNVLALPQICPDSLGLSYHILADKKCLQFTFADFEPRSVDLSDQDTGSVQQMQLTLLILNFYLFRTVVQPSKIISIHLTCPHNLKPVLMMGFVF